MKQVIKMLAAGMALCATLLSTSQVALADDFSAAKKKIESTLGLSISAIADSPVPGLIQLVTDRGLFYATEDGTYFLQARVFNLDEDMRNETEVALADIRLAGVDDFKDSVIEFKAKDEKYVVNIFTDTTCGYCRKLHNQIKDYNDLGITVRYLAFPRGGVNSGSYDNLVSVWCAEDQQKAMTAAQSGSDIDSQTCANQVAQQYQFGQKIGVNGTPNIILPDGSIIPGYQPPKNLEQALKQLM